MTATIDYSKISITAKLVAFFRQFSDIPFAQDVASYVHAEEALNEIAGKLQNEGETLDSKKVEEESKTYAPLLEARYKSIVEVIGKTGITQVLELASGFSLRGLAMTQNAEISYVESDLSGLNAEKEKLIADLRVKYKLPNSGNHHVVTANALEMSDLEAATASLKHDQPLIVVNEGLIPYLSVEERNALAGNVRKLLSQFARGAWITPDFTTKQLAENVSESRRRIRKAIHGTTDRQLQEAAFDSEEEIDQFIREQGFEGTCTNQTDEVTELVSPKRLGLSNQVIERLKPHMRIWLLMAK